MFDGLKDKLSSFTSDVEEDVDEDELDQDVPEDADDSAEHVDDTATGKQADNDGGVAADTNDSGVTADTNDGGVTADADDSGVTADTNDGGVTADAADDGGVTADADDATTVETDSDDAEIEDEESDSGRRLTEKAKILATGKSVIDEEDLQGHLDDLELALLSSDVEMGVAGEILDGVEQNLVGETRRRLSSTGNIVRDALREALYDVISVGQFDFEQRIAEADKPVVIIFTGVNGVGKTTTIAKLSERLENRGLSTVLANGDTYRAGANEQLQKHADNLGQTLISHEQGSDPAAVIYDAVEYANANNVDVVLGDTAGRLHTSDDLMAQLEKIDRVIDPDMTIFVDEAVAGQDAVNRAREFDEAAEIDGAVLTKADADPQGGAAISIAHVTGKPILFLGTGQDYDDLERFDPEEVVDRLLVD